MRVLVTGGSGFLGSHVAEQLKARDHDVICLVRGSSNTAFLETLGVTLAKGAVDDRASLDAAARNVDAVIHCAGLVKAKSREEFDRVHVDGTTFLLDACIANAPKLRRFVHVSTAGVMGPGRPGEKLSADAPTNPQTMYAKSKLAGEGAALAFKDKLPITILRPPAIYGPRDNEILQFFQMVRRTRVAVRLGDSMKSLSMVYGADCADACIRAIEADVPSGSIYFVDDGRSYAFEDLARAIATGYGFDLLGTVKVPKAIIRAAAKVSDVYAKAADKAVMFSSDKLGELFIEHFVVDASRAREDLGWEPKVMFPEGARLTAQWYRENGWD
jgi:2-alkyl-3-oxoalkanoate reductase